MERLPSRETSLAIYQRINIQPQPLTYERAVTKKHMKVIIKVHSTFLQIEYQIKLYP